MMRDLPAAILTIVLCSIVPMALAAYSASDQQHQHPATPGAHRHEDAATLKNPIAADAASIAAGKQVYEKQCASCHGATGKGDGAAGEKLNPKPANLTDAGWKHGSTDGEIFTVVREGVKNTGMKAFERKLTPTQTWQVVNYVRSLGTGPAQPR